MHKTQRQLLDLITNTQNFGEMSLRKIAELVGATGKPQLVKHHLQELAKNGFITLNLKEKIIKINKNVDNKFVTSNLYSIPVYGSANCGPASILAEQDLQGYVKVSKQFLPPNPNKIFALVADGNSMNQVNFKGKNIESGDLVLVDSEQKIFKDGDLVVAVIDGLATIKKYSHDPRNQAVVLKPQSSEKFLPIYLHEDDNFVFNGKVIDIIKN